MDGVQQTLARAGIFQGVDPDACLLYTSDAADE